jgi:leucyl aminopeptidase
MKHIIIFCLIACFFGINAQDDEMRLIRFNETYTKWMSLKEVDEMVAECAAKAGHTGFMDITERPDFVPLPQRKVSIPGGPTHQAVVNRLKARASIANVWDTIDSLSNDYNSRYYTLQSGVDAVNWLASEYRRIAGSRLGVDIHVYIWSHSWAQPSVIAEITGTVHPTERVVIGGHIDSTAGAAGNRAPGADDDASGSSTVLEIFRILATDTQFKPERTIEFQAYAAEEVGLRGSQDIAAYYSQFNYNVIGMMQLDMTGYDGSSSIGLVTDYTNQVLTAFLRQCLGAYCTIPVQATACGYGCSDHASWYNYGYPSAFTFESTFSSSNPYIHTASDTLNRLTQSHALQFVYAGLGFCVELSYSED